MDMKKKLKNGLANDLNRQNGCFEYSINTPFYVMQCAI